MKLLRLVSFTLALFVALLCTAALPGYAETNASLTINVVGQGDATASPGPPYTEGQVVTLTAIPDTGWTFDHWSLDDDGSWWDSGWDYRLKISVAANGVARQNKPAEANVNFTQLLTSLGKSGAIDPNSIRVVEVNNSNQVLDEVVPFQFDPAADFNALANAAGTVVWIMEGATAAGATRHYHIYFDVTGKGIAPPSVTPQVTFTDNITDEGRNTFRIVNNSATYYYDKKGGGFSSVQDNDDNDWVSWNSADGAEGEFRGIPNMVRPSNGGHFHPGANTSTSWLLNQGPIKVTITSLVPKNKNRWEAIWEFYPDYVQMTVLDAGYDYWFLYEGTPGGSLEVNSDYVVRSNGTQTNASASWTQALGPEQWVYFADPVVDRAIFFAQHNEDAAADSYVPSLNVMTRFGFGRDGVLPLIDNDVLPAYFTLGLLDDTAFADASQDIRDAYKELNVTAAAAEIRAGAGLGNQSPVNFTITGDQTITATFTPMQYTLTVATSGPGSVAKEPDKPTYDHGEVVTLTANPAASYAFAGWGGALSGITNPQTIQMLGNRSVTANFVTGYTINTSTDGHGSIMLEPELPAYAPDQQVKVTAVPDPGYTLASWGGALSGTTNPQTINVTGNLDISAAFAEAQYTLTVIPLGNGSFSKSPDLPTYKYGQVVALTATAATGWVFTGWSGDVSSIDNPLEITIEDNTSVTGNFSEVTFHTLDVTTVGQGSVAQDPPTGPYLAGTEITLTAAPAAGWSFAGWSGDLTGSDNQLSFLISQNTAVTATFVQPGNLISDGFNRCTLNTSLWTFVDPRGDSSYEMTGTTLEITVPASEEGHNIWTDGNNAARMMQPADNSDFQIQARFNSEPSAVFQLQGILIEEDGANLIRFDSYFGKDSFMHVYVQSFNNGVATKRADIKLPSIAPLFMQVTRAGNEWTMEFSTNGTTWQEAIVFSYGLNVGAVGVFAGNSQPEQDKDAPAHTAVVDYFFNTADGSPPVDSPLLQVNAIGPGSVQKNPNQDIYTCNQSVTVTAFANPGASFSGWTGDVQSLTNPLTLSLTEPTTINAVFEGAGFHPLYLPIALR